MHVEALNIFCDVVRHQSFSRGALVNSVSQSAASQAVRQIERRLGTQLIDRSKRPWQLTPEGKVFFRGCQEIVDRYHQLEVEVKRLQDVSGYTVRLASIYSIGLHDLSGYVDRFRVKVPGAEVRLEYMHPDEVYEQVMSDQFDLGLISFANPRRELNVIPWKDQSMVVACLPGHRFSRPEANPQGLAVADLAGEAFVTFDKGLPVRREIDRFLRKNDAEVRVVAEFDNIENIKRAVEDGAGIAILPEPTMRREVQAQTLMKVPLRLTSEMQPLIRPVSIIHRRKRHLNPAVTEFIALLLSEEDDAESRARIAGGPGKPGKMVAAV
jgi:DNA-binding transcriptional LysR family regulator